MKKPITFYLTVVAHVLAWLLLFDYLADAFLVLDVQGVELPRSYISDTLLYGMSFNAVIFYLNYSYLIGKYMTHHFRQYAVMAGTLLILITLLESAIDVLQMNTSPFASVFDLSWVLFSFNLKVHIGFWVMAIILKISVDWVHRVKLQKHMESSRVETELAFLKSQIHPHFLFNTLNTLYSSAYENGDSDTANGIGKLSHLLRYMLYETQDKKVLLEKEIEYIENYIDLQEMRFANEVTVTFTIKGDTEGFTIAPMILITLVENAFKHGITPAAKTNIDIMLDNRVDKFIFQVKNDRLRERPQSELEKGSGGLGLINLKKRLELLYPSKYTFQTYEDNGKFIAYLELL